MTAPIGARLRALREEAGPGVGTLRLAQLLGIPHAELEGRELDKLNRAVGADLGANTVTLVDGVEMQDGEIVFHLIVLNAARG